MASDAESKKVTLRDDQGDVTHELSMVNGVPEGEVKLFSGGRLEGRLEFHAGRQHGESVFYDSAGRVAMRAQYRDGKLHGDSLQFGPDGKVLRKCVYRYGRLHGPSVQYYPSGKPREVVMY